MGKGVVAVALAVATTLVAGVAGVASHDSGSRPRPLPTTTSVPAGAASTPGPGPGARPALDEVVGQLQGFVERERGLSFKQPVNVALLADTAFRARVTETDEDDKEEVREAEAVLRAMGLLGPNVDLVKDLEEFAAAAVVGFYDSDTKELVVRGGKVTPFVRLTIVHELTHALEDQHFNLNREELDDEASLGFTALVEGSALAVEDRYARSLPPRERLEAGAEEARLGDSVPDSLPDAVALAVSFPYTRGPDLARAVVRAGGQARLNAAFANPPASTEQVLDPQRFLGGDSPRPVPVPKADRPPFDDGEIGQLFLILMLRSELEDDRADEAARGWGGDRYVAWKDGERTCVRMEFVMDTPEDTLELVRALSGWAERRPSGSASALGTLVNTCG